MNTRQLHLVRHGEVDNPDGILYGRLPGFGLTPRGRHMAFLAADELRDRGRKYSALYASPLLRAQQSARPISETLGLRVQTEPLLVEPTNKFEGLKNTGPDAAYKQPKHWLKLWNPLLPSWGEPHARIARRALAALDAAWLEAEQAGATGDIVMVSHQAVIWAAHNKINGLPLAHNPANRRCDLSSVTSFTKTDGVWRELSYVSPAADLLDAESDRGAV